MLEEDKTAAPEHHEAGSSVPRWVTLAVAVLAGGLGFGLYMGHTSKQELQSEIAKSNQRAEAMEKLIQKSSETIADLQGELKVTSEKLGLTTEELNRARAAAQTIRKQQQAADEVLLAQIDKVKEESATQISKVAGDVSGAKSEIDATRKDLEATKSGLQRVVGDAGVMSGLIARNKEELEELKRRGERNVFDFDIRKTKDMQRVGPVQMRLQKADFKKHKYTLTLFADDKSIEKKDKTVNEPVQFYVGGVRTPYELVVFQMSKDRIIGYLTTPKEVARQ